MPSMTVRDIPKDIMQRLRKAAAEQRRSINAQAVCWLEKGAREWMGSEEQKELLRRIKASREATYQRHGLLSDSTEIIRQMRENRARRS